MKLYLVRHGETDWNVLDKKQGTTDVPLNEVGRKQAEKLREEIRDLEFDVCIASPLKRAYETAEIITGGRYKIMTDKRLVERSFGGFEGTLNKDWEKLSGGVDTWDRKLIFGGRGMETAKETLARARDFLDDIKKRYAGDAKILVVAHGSLLKALHFEILGYDDGTNFHTVYFGNAEMREYNLE